MSLEAGLLLVVAIAILAAVVWMGVAMRAELKAVRGKLEGLQAPGSEAMAAAPRANPRLAAAREAAAARAAKRPGRMTVKRI